MWSGVTPSLLLRSPPPPPSSVWGGWGAMAGGCLALYDLKRDELV